MDVLRIVKKADLTSAQKIILMYVLLPNFTNMSQAKHADHLRISVRAFGTALRGLHKKGYIEIRKGEFNPLKGKGPDHYVPTRKARDLASVVNP